MSFSDDDSATLRRFEIPVYSTRGLVLHVVGTNVARIPQKALYGALHALGKTGALWLPSGIRLWSHLEAPVDVTDGVILKKPAPAAVAAVAAPAGLSKFSIRVTNVDGLELGVRAESPRNVPVRALYAALHSHGRAGTLRLMSGKRLPQLREKAVDVTGGLLLDASIDTYVFQFKPSNRADAVQHVKVDAPVGVGAIFAKDIAAALRKHGIDPTGLATLRVSDSGATFALDVVPSRSFLPDQLQSSVFTVVKHAAPDAAAPRKGILKRTGGRQSTSSRRRLNPRTQDKGKRQRRRRSSARRRRCSASTCRRR